MKNNKIGKELHLKAQQRVLKDWVLYSPGEEFNWFNENAFPDYKEYYKAISDIQTRGEEFGPIAVAKALGDINKVTDIIGFSEDLSFTESLQLLLKAFIENSIEELRAKEKAGEITAQEYANKVALLESRFRGSTWKRFAVTEEILKSPDTAPLITRGEDIYLCRGEILKISGHKGNKKSLLALTLGACAVNGGSYIDNTLNFSAPEPLKVLFVDTELPKRAYKSRLLTFKRITRQNTLPEDKFIYLNMSGISPEEKLNTINLALRDFAPDLVVFDSIRDFVNDFNDAKEATRIKDYLKAIAERHNLGVIVTIHLNDDAGGISGNNKGHLGRFMADYCDLGIKLHLNDDEERSTKLTFDKVRNSQPEEFSFIYNSNKHYLDTWEPLTDKSEEYKKQREARQIFEDILKDTPGMKYNELVRALVENGKLSERKAKAWLAKTDSDKYKTYRGVIVCENNGLFKLIPENVFVEQNEDLPLF